MPNPISIALLVACTVIILGGCASDPWPSAELMKAETATYQLPKLPANGKATVYVVIPSRDVRGTPLNIFLDDLEDSSEMGHVKFGQYIYFNILPGAHKVFYGKSGNAPAETLVLAKAGDTIFIMVEPSGNMLGRDHYAYSIEPYAGKYYVKASQVGTIIKMEK